MLSAIPLFSVLWQHTKDTKNNYYSIIAIVMTTLKDFLEACEKLGTLRLIVTSSAAVLEARGKLEKIF